MLTLLAAAIMGSNSTATLSAPWSDLEVISPTPNDSNEDRTITWSGGGTRNITASGHTPATLQYRLGGSGSYTTYSAPISLASGNQIGWRLATSANLSDTVSVYVGGVLIDTFNATSSGWE